MRERRYRWWAGIAVGVGFVLTGYVGFPAAFGGSEVDLLGVLAVALCWLGLVLLLEFFGVGESPVPFPSPEAPVSGRKRSNDRLARGWRERKRLSHPK